MLQNKVGYDIIQKIGGVSTIDEALGIFEKQMDAVNLAKIQKIKNADALLKIANAIVMCRPDDIFVNTGSDEDVQKVRQMSLEKGEEAALAMENHTVHFDLAAEQGRIIDRTFYIANPDEEISSLANRMDRDDALKEVQDVMGGIMKGKTMIIGFYNRGPVGSKGSNPALEVSSSLYVSHSAELLYRNVFEHFDEEVARQGHFYANIHSEGLNRAEDLPNARVFMDRSFQTTYSMNCTYAGNTLLLKKGNHRFSVDKAVYTNRGNELAEHMFIT
jgi:phosphoenolpyruvate carboxykinase (GTP)